MNELAATLWQAADKLRGALPAGEYEDVVLGLVFLNSVADAAGAFVVPPAARWKLLADRAVSGSWARPWNSKSERRVGDAPPSALWATDEGGFGQVGCVYTAQGFEYDWNGVIVGPDLVWRGGRFVSVREANKDPDFRNSNRVPDNRFDVLVRHVYKVLLTRGMIGTVIYSTDRETREALRSLIGSGRRDDRALLDVGVGSSNVSVADDHVSADR